jgi:flavin-binding protein dodecin
MIQQLPGRVDKVIQIVAVSPESWEAAAQNAVAQATKSIRDLTSATVVEQDLSLANGAPLYRIKLQVAFQVDRTRTDAAGTTVQVRRFLLVANQTLANAELSRFVSSTLADQCAEFHVVVPQNAPSILHADPATGLIGPSAHSVVAESRQAAREEGEVRLASFREALGDMGHAVTGEVMLGDPATAARSVLARSSFDEIIVSTLPVGVSRWLKLDLPSRLQRACNLPVTTLVQEEPS